MPLNELFFFVASFKSISNEILFAEGTLITEEDAKVVSEVLIAADKRGIDSHGVNRLKPIYIDRIRDGILNPVTNMEIVKEGPTTAVIDGHNGMGHVISKKAMQMAIDKAKTYGMGMVAVRNSTHYGIAGYYTLMAVENGMIGISGTNARPSIAPTFGVENMLGTNPLTFSMPSDEEFPFFLDCATSITQRGKIELYQRKGKDCPKGWVIDEDGNSKTDSTEVLKDLISGKAALTPLGGVGEELGGYKYAPLKPRLGSFRLRVLADNSDNFAPEISERSSRQNLTKFCLRARNLEKGVIYKLLPG